MSTDSNELNKNIRAQILKLNSSGASKEDITWAFTSGTASILDESLSGSFSGVPYVSLAVGGLQTLVSLVRHSKGMAETLIPNPMFIVNGHDEPASSYTQKYLKARRRKNTAGGVFAFGGAVASMGTQVDVAGILQHGNATASTAAHLVKLRAQAQRYKKSETLTAWVDLLIKLKTIKAAIRGTELVGASVPVGAVGITTGILASAAKLGVSRVSLSQVCIGTALDLHWRAYQEQAISSGFLGSGGKIGPASNMLYELFCRRGIGRIMGQYDVDRIIKEPVGWYAINDKLMLI